MTNWIRHTDIAEGLCLCQFSLWSIAEFAKFFPFVTLHLAAPVLFSTAVFGGLPVGSGAACIIYASFPQGFQRSACIHLDTKYTAALP